MLSEWSIRDEILSGAHRWPVIVLFCLIGGLLGGGIALILPSPYQATTELYVGLNVYRAAQDRNVLVFTDGVRFNYVDDYKNWQMADLNTLVLANDVTRETLDRLRAQDPFWLNVTREQLASMLHVYWRNAGRWRLVAENPDPKRSVEMVTTWRDVVLKTVSEAIAQSQKTVEFDNQLQSIASAQASAKTRVAELTQIRDALEAWEKAASQNPADQAMDTLNRWQMRSWTARAAGFDLAWKTLLDTFPAVDAPQSAYLAWLNPVMASLDQEIQMAQSQVDSLDQQQAEAEKQYANASNGSRGFSANMSVESASDATPKPTQVRSTGLLALVGFVLGLLAWLILWLARITLRMRK